MKRIRCLIGRHYWRLVWPMDTSLGSPRLREDVPNPDATYCGNCGYHR